MTKGDAREIAHFDELDAKADEWMAECGVKEMVANIVVVFANWASPELLARFREQVEAIMHLSFVEGAIRSRDSLPSPVSVPEGDAREIARRIVAGQTKSLISSPEELAAEITAALLSARREGIEKAAAWHDQRVEWETARDNPLAANFHREAAAAIRSLSHLPRRGE